MEAKECEQILVALRFGDWRIRRRKLCDVGDVDDGGGGGRRRRNSSLM